MKATVIFAALLLAGAPASAQPQVPPCTRPAVTYQDLWCERVREIVEARTGTGGKPQVGFRDQVEEAVQITGRNWAAFLLYAMSKSDRVDLAPVEDARTDKQLGAPAGTAGSTSAVSKGAVPSILAFAVENGALTQSSTATTVTLRGNLVGWLDLVKNQGFIASYEDDGAMVRQLRRVSYSLTLNTATGGVAAVSPPSGAAAITPDAIRAELERTRQQLAGYSVRVALWDQRDPRTTANRLAIATLLDTIGVELLQSDQAFDAFINSDDYQRKWLPETADLLSDVSRPLSPTEIQRILYRQLESVRLMMVNRIESFDAEVARGLLALQAFDKARIKVFEAMQKRPLVAFEYVNAKTRDLPDKSTLRLIAEGQWGPRIDLTANVSMTLQHTGTVPLPEPRSVDGARDFQAAAQLDVPLGSLAQRLSAGTGIGAPVVGVAYLSQKLTERAAVSFAGNTFTVEPGWIHLVQARVMVPVKGSGVKIPLSISYANRTELLKEKEIRGQIGLTFDMDVLSALVRR
jgi:hypothetical protein